MAYKTRLEPSDLWRVRNSRPKKLSVTDGPFAETKELVMGGKDAAVKEEEVG